MTTLKAPFPWFGGKRRVAPEIWAAFGDVDDGPRTGAETVNDADSFIANLWRAIQYGPDEVARYADWPVNETDLFARHLWLVHDGAARIANLEADPEAYDAKVAGWWLWGVCAWIGGGWCGGAGPWTRGPDGLPHFGDAGRGVNRQLPHLGDVGQGVNRKLPHLGDAGRGACNGSDMTAGGSGAPKASWDRSLWQEGQEPLVYGYMRALQARLRRVRVCCGDWSRVVTDGALAHGATVGVLLDPPYDEEIRSRGLYAVESGSLSAAVRAWAVAHGEDHRIRTALCGYEGEHELPASWRVHSWASSGAYLGGSGEDSPGRANRHRERIWFSPGCLSPRQPSLFEPGNERHVADSG